MAALATAEHRAITGDARETMKQAHYAREHLDEETPSWYRAQDLYLLARNAVEDNFRRRGKKPPPMPGDKPEQEEGETPQEQPEESTESPDATSSAIPFKREQTRELS